MGQEPRALDPQARASSPRGGCLDSKQIRLRWGVSGLRDPFSECQKCQDGEGSPVAELGIVIITAVGVTWGREDLGTGRGAGRTGCRGRERARQYLTTILPPYQPSEPGLAGSRSHFQGLLKEAGRRKGALRPPKIKCASHSQKPSFLKSALPCSGPE